MKNYYLKTFGIILMSFFMIVGFCGCGSSEDVCLGRYYNNDMYIEVMENNKISFSENFEFGDVGVADTSNLADREIKEVIGNTFYFASENNRLYVDLVGIYDNETGAQICLHFIYNKQNQTLTFGEELFVLTK